MTQHLSWEAIEAINRGAYRVLLYGPPGTGKTRSAYNAAAALKKSLYNITLSDETPAAELRGHYIPQGSKFVWQDGPAVTAYREGAVLCLDEIDKASQDCLDFLHGLLNDPEVARLTLPTGEVVTPAAGFQVIATMNGDIMDLQPSLQDRFSIAIEVTQPHPAAIASLPKDLQGAAKKLEAYDVVQRPATVRRWHAFATLRANKEIGPENAAKAVFAHRAPELLDAIGFSKTATTRMKAELTVVPEGMETGTLIQRATAYHAHNKHAIGYDDGVYKCPSCDTWYGSDEFEEDSEDPQRDAFNAATLCCYSDEAWLSHCIASGRSPIAL